MRWTPIGKPIRIKIAEQDPKKPVPPLWNGTVVDLVAVMNPRTLQHETHPLINLIDPLGLSGYSGSPAIPPVGPYGPTHAWRLPDYLAANVNIAIPNPWTGNLIGWSGSMSADRYGDWFWSPLGAGIGKSATIVSFSATANWLDQSCKPSQSHLGDFLSANGFNATAGFWGGLSQSYTPGSGFLQALVSSPRKLVSVTTIPSVVGNVGFGW